MNFLMRIWNIIVGRTNAALGQLESPEDQLRYFVTQLDGEMSKLRKAVTGAVAEEKKLKMRIENQLMQAQDWEKKAMFALKGGQEELAREALVRKGDIESEAFRLKTEWEKQSQISEQLQQSLKNAQTKAEKAKRDYTVLIARYQTAKTTQSMNQQLAGTGEKSSSAVMEGLNNKILQIEADSQAELQVLGDGGSDIEAKFVDLERQMRGDEALAQLKAKMGGNQLPAGTRKVGG